MMAGEQCYVIGCKRKAVQECGIALKKTGAFIARVRLCEDPACVKMACESMANTVELRPIP